MKNLLLIASVLAIAIIYGTSFLGIKIALDTIPPIYLAGIRHFLAGTILFIYLLLNKQLKWIGWDNLKKQLIISTFILIITNGMVTIAEEHIPSNLTSLINAFAPILVFIGSIALKLQPFRLKPLFGVILGFSGILFIFWDDIDNLANPDYRRGMFFLILAVLGNASGALYIRKTNYKNNNIPLNLFYQFIFASIVQISSALFVGEELNIENWSAKSIVAMLYLTIFASIIGYLSFTYALTQISAIRVSLISYANTCIAIFLGWLILDEPVNANFIIATVLIILGIFITNYNPEMFKRKNKKIKSS